MAETPRQRCDWRSHTFAFAPCGHVFCQVCQPDRFSADPPCESCDAAFDAADELADAQEARQVCS